MRPGLLARSLEVLARGLSILPENRALGAFLIRGLDGSPYLTRGFGPRLLGCRLILHHIWRPDADLWPHNHPWRRARFLILHGGYVEERRVDGRAVRRYLGVGDVNELDADDFHRVVWVAPDTWTLGVVQDRCQDWSFWVDGEGPVPHDVYFARTGYVSPGRGL